MAKGTGYSLWGHKESDLTEGLTYTQLVLPGNLSVGSINLPSKNCYESFKVFFS